MYYIIDEARPWIGGTIKGGDPATYYPDLWTWLVKDYGIKSVVDVGCGEGIAVRHFREMGCKVLGIDGIPQEDRDIFEHDYQDRPYVIPHVDLCWSCEFVEHIEEQFMPNFLSTFKCASLILMTHASPGQAGYHHVNCQSSDYWKGVMASIGYKLDEKLTQKTCELAALNLNPWNHYIRSGMAFR